MGQEIDRKGRDPSSDLRQDRAKPADPLPGGIQRLLGLASVDPEFLDMLLSHRGKLARVLGIGLSQSEERILAAVPDQKLREMALRLAPPAVPRRRFLRRLAAVAVMLLSGAGVVTACKTQGDAGKDALPDVPDEAGDDARVLVEKDVSVPVERPRGSWVMPYGIRGPRVMPDPHMARETEQHVTDPLDEDLVKERGCHPAESGGYMPMHWIDKPRCPGKKKASGAAKKPKKPKPWGVGVMFGFGGLGLRSAKKK